MTEQETCLRAKPLVDGEWVPIYDANSRLLFELSLLSGNIRIEHRSLTTVVDPHIERLRHLKFFRPRKP